MTTAYQPHFMIVPSLGCNAECAYCFGPHNGGTMSIETLQRVIDYISAITGETGQKNVSITFHGGEPLLAGHDFFERALSELLLRFGSHRLKLAIQSNLWLLDSSYCKLFNDHNIETGTSLDGPEPITDRQRGKGYYAKTMNGIQTAHSHGLTINCIATFTPWSIKHWQEVFDFFISRDLDFSIHPSVARLNSGPSRYTLSPTRYGDLLESMLEYYIRHRHLIRVPFFDQICQSVAEGQGKVCTFRDCLGMFIAIDPDGGISPCQRFCGDNKYRLGNITDNPTLDDLFSHPEAIRMKQHQQWMVETCRNCDHFEYCNGGCYYNALAEGPPGKSTDPYCNAYFKTFNVVKQRLQEEMASEENIHAVAMRPPVGKGNPLLQKGPLIELARYGRHPSQIFETAKLIVSSVELAKGPNVRSAADRILENRIFHSREKVEAVLRHLENILTPNSGQLNNLYLYITLRCPLSCSHCYLYGNGENETNDEMAVGHIESLIRESKSVGFRQVVILGGEPLFHLDCDTLLEQMPEIRRWASPMNLVLRTNFVLSFSHETLRKIAAAFDQVVVSLDGSEQTHDARRGTGTYQRTATNLHAFRQVAKGVPGAAKLSLAAAMSYAEIQGEPGESVRKLGRQLDIKRIRFRPLLPLGRARKWDKPPKREALGGFADPMESIEYGFYPVSSCGLGQNIYIEPTGDALPCYAFRKPHTLVGNVITQGLRAIIESDGFKKLSRHTVDTNPGCRTCDVRYLCGGACRAWGGEATQYDPDAPPANCQSLERKARSLLTAAQQYLNEGINAPELLPGDRILKN